MLIVLYFSEGHFCKAAFYFFALETRKLIRMTRGMRKNVITSDWYFILVDSSLTNFIYFIYFIIATKFTGLTQESRGALRKSVTTSDLYI
jgi:hypothetical protein